MGAGSYERKTFVGGAPARTITASIDNVVTTFSISSDTGWPTTTGGPFVAIIDRGLASEEKILVRARTGTVLSDIQRGYDDTVAQSHAANATIEHGIDASTIDQANRMANLLENVGELLGHNGVNPVAVPAGTVDMQVLMRDSGEPEGVIFGRLPTVEFDANAPAVTGIVRIWHDETLNILRSSDGATWRVPSQVLVFASAAARTTSLGPDPVPGTTTFRLDDYLLEVYDGGAWVPMARRDEAVARVVDVAERDTLFPFPEQGQQVFVLSTNQTMLFRGGEWHATTPKFTVSATAPVDDVVEGDIWLQPES